MAIDQRLKIIALASGLTSLVLIYDADIRIRPVYDTLNSQVQNSVVHDSNLLPSEKVLYDRIELIKDWVC